MKEKMKKILCMLVLATVLLNTCAISVFALPEDNEALEVDTDYSEDTTYSMLRGIIWIMGTTSSKKMASNKVAVSGNYAVSPCLW